VKKTKAGRAAREEDLPAEASLLRYIESSALVAAILERDAEALAEIREIGQRATSALTLAETIRALIRARVAGRITPREERAALRDFQWFVRACLVISISDQILERAGRPFPGEPVRTLDAIHLATLESLGEAPQLVTVVTRDDRIARNARALGYAVA
jgi:predicted nucleic acid-binding protein